MTAFYPYPVNSSSSSGFSIVPDIRVSDPFTPGNMTQTEIVASLPVDMGGFWVMIYSNNRPGIFTVCKGSSGSEALVAALPLLTSRGSNSGFFVPISLDAGDRVTVAASHGSSTNPVHGQLIFVPRTDFRQLSFTRMEAGPFDLSNTSADYGTWLTLDPGSTVNTMGAWSLAEISGVNSGNNLINGALSQNYSYVGALFNGNVNSAQQDHDRLIEWGTGDAGSEVALGDPIFQRASGAEAYTTDQIVIWSDTSQQNTVGDKHSFRMQASINDATDRLAGAILFGLR